MIEVMMIPHLHRKNPSTFDSENSRTIKDMKKYFQASRKRLISFIFCENPNSQKLPTFNSKVYFTKRPTNKKTIKFGKITVVTKTLNAKKICFFFIFEFNNLCEISQ